MDPYPKRVDIHPQGQGDYIQLRCDHLLGRELKDRMVTAGFRDVKLYGNLNGEEYGQNAQRLIVVAEGRNPRGRSEAGLVRSRGVTQWKNRFVSPSCSIIRYCVLAPRAPICWRSPEPPSRFRRRASPFSPVTRVSRRRN